jgi:carbon starvation protein
VLFSHHYATIAGAGPIVGPTIAAIYGIWPAWLWVIAGAIFFGAVHDYTSMFVSLREKGRTVAEITGSLTGRWGFVLYITFTLLLIVIVTAAFLDLSVNALTSIAPLQTIQLPAGNPFGWEIQTAEGGAQLVRIGGIATMSVIIITLLAPLMGLAIHRFKVDTRVMALVALLVAGGSIWFGLYHPVTFGELSAEGIRLVWMLALSLYVLLASALPIWVILQPRDFVNAFTLYGGMALLIVVAIVGGLRGLATDPALSWNIAEGTAQLGLIWPILFITIACGAISGFHSLVASGTSSKQANREGDARRIGYGGMLTEGLLAVLVLLAIGAGLGYGQLMAVQFPEGASGNPVLAFALGAGLLTNKALGIPVYLGTIFGLLMIEGFLVTTLDTAVRLNRYLFEELWTFLWGTKVPALLRSHYFNAGISVVVMLAIAYPNGWRIIWPVFGTANQLLAALTLATVSIWLAFRLRPTWFTLLPAIFMMLTCLGSLTLILKAQLGSLVDPFDEPNWAVLILAALLFALGLGVILLAGTRLWEVYSGKRVPIREDPADVYLEPTVPSIAE